MELITGGKTSDRLVIAWKVKRDDTNTEEDFPTETWPNEQALRLESKLKALHPKLQMHE